MITKICSKCKKELDISCFYKRNDRKRGYMSWCKSCCKQYNKSVIPERPTTKICSKCKKELNVSCFHKRNNRKNGCASWCIDCHTQYNKDNASRKAKYNKQYNIDNAPQISEQKKQYRKDNPEKVAKSKHEYYIRNSEEILEKDRQRLYSPAVFKTYFEQLKQFEEIRSCFETPELLEVKCAYCGKWLIPTNVQVKNRIIAISIVSKGEQRFYCSENCKKSCPVYNQKMYPKGFKKATSREVVPLLRQLVLKRDNYACQLCGATSEIAQLHVHHEKSYTLNRIMANDPDNCITLCKKCHKWIHSKKGCKHNDLKCKTNKQK